MPSTDARRALAPRHQTPAEPALARRPPSVDDVHAPALPAGEEPVDAASRWSIACLNGARASTHAPRRQGADARRRRSGDDAARAIDGPLFDRGAALRSSRPQSAAGGRPRHQVWARLVPAIPRCAPFCSVRGLAVATILYACGLAVAGAAMLSLRPHCDATRTHLPSSSRTLAAGLRRCPSAAWDGRDVA